ncbi:MAG TPA: tetratricopeptide repeat protein [Hydrogenophaga sp.]|uniref:YfgM family protein n=1 Tax=Hydrogenophaga sp. TaxID=1904254 RepID=UPI002BD1FF0C|nr:tetratricopeptide repeat protein [Hydrogenophaga sp.]HMN91855.1 tetratricopeptide repeat protein [Hydrogenophaga sp.]HMP09005.1 tetratricopeptide repeat protein [Hydrogenophaga sp.]
MAKHLDLEEQEQLDQIKHFWARYGNLITWVLIVVFGSVAAWNGWNYWQRSQAVKASTLYDEVERASLANDTDRLARTVQDMQSGFGRTAYASQASLLAASTWQEAGKTEEAMAALTWVSQKGADDAFKAVARLRLAAMHLDSGALDQASAVLAGSMPSAFAGLQADRRGDVLMAQGRAEEAKAQYQAAWSALAERIEYRRIVEVKLASLGVNVSDLPSGGAAR